SLPRAAARLPVCCVMSCRPLGSTLFPYTTLFRSVRTMQGAQRDYSPDELAAIRGPAIAIAAGETDEFITREHAEYLARQIPGARLVVFPGTGHFPPWEQPEAVNGALLDFLAAPSDGTRPR